MSVAMIFIQTIHIGKTTKEINSAQENVQKNTTALKRLMNEMKLANQIKVAKTRLKTATLENNPTEKEVWKSILNSLVKLEQISEIIKNEKDNIERLLE